jgi:CDP-diglyceride synthetase
VTDVQQAAAVTIGALMAGSLLLGALSIVPATAAHTRGLWRMMRTECLIVAVFIAIFISGTLVIELCLVVVAARLGFESATEWYGTTSLGASERWRMAMVAGGGLAAITAIFIFLSAPSNLIVGVFLLGLLSLGVPQFAYRPLLRSWFPVMARVAAFPGTALFAIALAAREPRCHVAMLLAFTLTELFDSFSVLGGKLFGKRKIFPRLSPNKTVEGLWSGLAILVVAASILPFVATIPLLKGVLAIALTAPAAVAGDLLGSAAKRAAGVKDYPTILEGQGGLLDILDAWLLTAPVFAGLVILMG